jgi:hypothetical protein
MVDPAPPKEKEALDPVIGIKRGYIYFATAGDDGLVKIGFTKDVGVRMRSLRTGNAGNIVAEEAFLSYFEAEKMVHKRFEKDRVRGEWFKLTDEIEELWDDILDYQRMVYRALPTDKRPDRLEDVFFELDAVSTILATINERWPREFVVPYLASDASAPNLFTPSGG